MMDATVFVIGGDEDVREVAWSLTDAANLTAQYYSRGEDFLTEYEAARRMGCAVLDLRLPDMSGLELQTRLRDFVPPLPTIMVSDRCAIHLVVRAVKQGAVDFIEKPVDKSYMRKSLVEALLRAARDWHDHSSKTVIINRARTLTPREREVMSLVVLGTANKNIAAVMGRSHKTIEIHRANMMRKMGIRSVAKLVSALHFAGLTDGHTSIHSPAAPADTKLLHELNPAWLGDRAGA